MIFGCPSKFRLPPRVLMGGMVAIAAFVALSQPATAWAADEPEMIVEVDRTRLYEGESVVYRVTLNHVENPREPDLTALQADFEVASLGQRSLDSRSVMSINGRVSEVVRRGRQYNYRLTPRRAGTLTIPAPTAEADGQQLRGREVTLTVLAPEEQDIVRMEIRTDRESVYPMQPFTVTLSVAVKALPEPFSDENPMGVQTTPPALNIPWAVDEQLPSGLKPKVEWRRWLGAMENNRGAGFNVNNLSRDSVFSLFNERRMAFLPPSRRVRLPDNDGEETGYWQFEFRRAFVAKRIGRYTFGPVSLKGAFATQLNSAGRPAGEDIYAVAKPLVVDVKDVPLEGRPESYVGAVGEFRLTTTLEPKKLRTGDPMTLTLSLSGVGTLEGAVPPDLRKVPAVAEHFKIYEATEKTKGNRRQFTYSLRPLDAEIREFPAVPVSYFSVDTERYVTLHSEAFPIEVTKAVRLARRDIIASPSGATGNHRELEMHQEGIFANITDLAQVRDESIHPERWLIVLVGLIVGYAILAVGVDRWWRIRGDTALLRRRAATGVARRRLHEAKSEFAAGRSHEGADRVQAALLGLVADKLDLPAAGLTSAEACRLLESLDVKPELVAGVRSLLESCEGVRYGASADGSATLGRDAEKLVRGLATALGKKRSPRT